MKKNLISFLVGLLFAIGLGISGMTNPQKVLSFLDIFGSWDPSLMFVMIGAIGTHLVAFKLITKRKAPMLDEKFHIPTNKKIGARLIIGSVLFGAGWGLAGFCPGPAIVSLATEQTSVAIFVLSMIAGMIIFKLFETKLN